MKKKEIKPLKKQNKNENTKIHLYAKEGSFLCDGQCGCQVDVPGYCAGPEGCGCGCGCGGGY